MNLFAEENYPNLLPKISLTSKDIEKDIATYPLTFLQNRPSKIEGGMELPMFVDAFYEYILANNSIPTQDGYLKYYVRSNIEHFRKHNLDKEHLLGLKGRVYRIYPSLVRDIHFAVYLRENLREGRILYNLKLDAVGTDIMLFYKDLNYGLRLFVDTYNSNRYKNKKDMKQTLFDNVTYIDLTLNLGTATRCGEFMLYGKEHLQKVQKESNMILPKPTAAMTLNSLI